MTYLLPLVACLTTVNQTAPIEVPFRIGETAIILDANVNGRDVSLMFDTGFTGAVVVDSSINLGKPTGKVDLRDFVRTQTADTVPIKSFKLGALSIDPKPEDMKAVVTDTGDISFSYNTHCDGILGFAAIKHQVTEINFEKGKFIFHPRSFDITQLKPDNQRTFLTKLLPSGHDAMEMLVQAPNGKSLNMALDTGNSFYATSYTDSLERIGIWDSRKPKYMSESAVASGNVETWHAKIPAMTIFGIPVSNPVFDVIDLPSSSADADGTVGFQFLKHFNIIIDYERRRVWFENFSGKRTEDPKGDIGVFAAYSSLTKRVVVHRVTVDGPAEKAGLKRGDELLSIGGVDLSRQSYLQLRRMFEGASGSKVKVVISREGQLKRYEIERQPLINEALGASS